MVAGMTNEAGDLGARSEQGGARSRRATSTAIWPLSSSKPILLEVLNTSNMANRGYDVVVDVDQEVCQLL